MKIDNCKRCGKTYKVSYIEITRLGYLNLQHISQKTCIITCSEDCYFIELKDGDSVEFILKDLGI